MNDPRYLHTEEKQEGETFFDVMNRLIARSKAVTADMEAVLGPPGGCGGAPGRGRP